MQSDEGEESGPVCMESGTALSTDEFNRLQQQLIELRNQNYELIEKNKQLQSQNSKSNETFRFATKVRRCRFAFFCQIYLNYWYNQIVVSRFLRAVNR